YAAGAFVRARRDFLPWRSHPKDHAKAEARGESAGSDSQYRALSDRGRSIAGTLEDCGGESSGGEKSPRRHGRRWAKFWGFWQGVWFCGDLRRGRSTPELPTPTRSASNFWAAGCFIPSTSIASSMTTSSLAWVSGAPRCATRTARIRESPRG